MCLLLRSGVCLATLPYRPDWWSAAEMVVLWRKHLVLGHLVFYLDNSNWQHGQFSEETKLLPFMHDEGHSAFQNHVQLTKFDRLTPTKL